MDMGRGVGTSRHDYPRKSAAVLVPAHAVVLLIALAIGFAIGALTLITGAPAAAALIAGLTSAGVSVVPLRGLIQ